jgi:midasin (ATPase involved in ribosome maturation)
MRLFSMQVTTSNVSVGRVSLPRFGVLPSTGTFSYTKHSLRLLERLAMCVSLKESVLLVGETGNGKTAVVQHLAHQVIPQPQLSSVLKPSDLVSLSVDAS